jgi:hypothetical protein
MIGHPCPSLTYHHIVGKQTKQDAKHVLHQPVSPSCVSQIVEIPHGSKYEVRSGNNEGKTFSVTSKVPIRRTKESPDIKLKKARMSPSLTKSANKVMDRLKTETKG